MRILGIETSCDETAMSIVEIKSEKLKVKNKEEIKVLSNIISSQVKLHAKYGGVVPSLAAREHVKNIKHVFELALKEAGIKDFKKEIDLVAVTRGPGLGPALLVGLTFAKTTAWINKKPLIGVNHLDGHIHSNWLQSTENSESKILNTKKIFPALNLIVSGGHTELVLMKNHGQYKTIGETLDDAVGEAFDKVARLLGLGYPGGPAIYKIAESGNSDKYLLPRPMAKSKNYNFSYSGLKTAVLYLIRDISKKSPSINSGQYQLSVKQKADIAASFQKAAIDVLIQKTMHAAKEYEIKSIMLSGGVSANLLLRSDLNRAAAELEVKYLQPKLEYTGDNATMIAIAGYFTYLKNKKIPLSEIRMDANLGF